MPDIPTEFNQHEMNDLKLEANRLGMTEEEFVTHATNRFVKNAKEDMRKRIENPKSLRIIK